MNSFESFTVLVSKIDESSTTITLLSIVEPLIAIKGIATQSQAVHKVSRCLTARLRAWRAMEFTLSLDIFYYERSLQNSMAFIACFRFLAG